MMQKNNKGLDVVIVLDRLRSAFNTGNIFRLADAVNAKEIIVCGYTPAPPHPKLAKTAMGADRMVKCRAVVDSLTAVKILRKEGIEQIIAVETTENAAYPWTLNYKFPLAFIFGNEALGIQKETLRECDGIVALPMMGRKTSINVGNCAAVVLYSALQQIIDRNG